MNEILLYFSIKYEGDFEKIYTAIMNKEKIDYENCEYSENSKPREICNKEILEYLKHDKFSFRVYFNIYFIKFQGVMYKWLS